MALNIWSPNNAKKNNVGITYACVYACKCAFKMKMLWMFMNLSPNHDFHGPLKQLQKQPREVFEHTQQQQWCSSS